MFLHIGGDVIVPQNRIIAILDAEAFSSNDSKEFLTMSNNGGYVISTDMEDVKSYIITDEGIYLSAITTTTLLKRFYDGHRQIL